MNRKSKKLLYIRHKNMLRKGVYHYDYTVKVYNQDGEYLDIEKLTKEASEALLKDYKISLSDYKNSHVGVFQSYKGLDFVENCNTIIVRISLQSHHDLNYLDVLRIRDTRRHIKLKRKIYKESKCGRNKRR